VLCPRPFSVKNYKRGLCAAGRWGILHPSPVTGGLVLERMIQVIEPTRRDPERSDVRQRCLACSALTDYRDPESRLCPDCHARHVRCAVCGVWYERRREECVHLVPLGDAHAGCGSGRAPHEHQDSFFSVMELLGDCRADFRGDDPRAALYRLVCRDALYTMWWASPGGPTWLQFRDLRQEPGQPCVVGRVAARTALGWPEVARLGLAWLLSLDAWETPGANALTARWLEEWGVGKILDPEGGEHVGGGGDEGGRDGSGGVRPQRRRGSPFPGDKDDGARRRRVREGLSGEP
jgi:hypothetical protein